MKTTSDNTILVVDDNPDDTELITRSLRRHEPMAKVVTMGDGEAALQYLLPEVPEAAGSDQPLPKFVLLDVRMPKLSGLEVLERLRADKRTRWLPIIILTSTDDRQEIKRSYEVGANSVIQKPIDYHTFAFAMQHIITYWYQLNRFE